ncbi:MAG: lipid-A-disaccharide synthase [Bacteroidota bacterium]
MKYYIIAGEASGDLHGSNLIKNLKVQDTGAEFRCWGGDLMQQAGADLVKHYNQMAFMGFTEVVKNLRTILKNIKHCKHDIREWKPDAIILIDYAGFNLRIAKFATEQGFKVFYYISPKVWVWKESRVKKIKKYVHHMFVILPFEVGFYKKHHYEVTYVGNPLVDAIENFNRHYNQSAEDFRAECHLDREKPIIALLAGSRKQEINDLLPIMCSISTLYPDYEFVLAAAASLPESFYKPKIEGFPVKMVYNKTYELLQHAHTAIVTSGTATLETGIFNVPEVVIYKTNPLTYRLGMLFVNITYISLVNLIMGKEVVKELIQFNLEKRTRQELDRLLNDDIYRQTMLDNLKMLNQKMGEPGASGRTARGILDRLMQ